VKKTVRLEPEGARKTMRERKTVRLQMEDEGKTVRLEREEDDNQA